MMNGVGPAEIMGSSPAIPEIGLLGLRKPKEKETVTRQNQRM